MKILKFIIKLPFRIFGTVLFLPMFCVWGFMDVMCDENITIDYLKRLWGLTL